MRKLSLEENLRHRLGKHLPGRRVHETSTTQAVVCLAIGAAAGIAAGMVLAQRFGGFGALGSRLYDSFHKGILEGYDADDYDEDYEGGFDDDSPEDSLDDDFADSDGAALDDDLEEEEEFAVGLGWDDEEGDEDSALDLADSGFDDEFDDSDDDLPQSVAEALEERVLVAYHNDPILSQRAIEIGATDDETIELTGWVHSDDEIAHAETLAKGTPGVEKVINKLTVRQSDSIN